MKDELIINDEIINYNNENILIFPVVHNSPVISGLLRKSIIKYQPDYIVVECLPQNQDLILKAVNTLPLIHFLEEQYNDKTSYTIIHPAEPIFEGIRTGIEIKSKIVFADHSFGRNIEETDDSIFLSLLSAKINLNKFWKTSIELLRNRKSIDDDKIREEIIGKIFYSTYKNNCIDTNKKIMLICGISHLIGILSNFKDDNLLINYNQILSSDKHLRLLHPDSYGEILEPSAFIIQEYEKSRLENNYDFEKSFFDLFKTVEKKYMEEVKQSVKLPNKNLFFRFAYKLALQHNSLIPSSLDMLLSARGCVDDDFSFHWYNTTAHYKWSPPEGSPLFKLKAEDTGGRSISFRFRTKIENKKRNVFRPITHSNRRQLDEWKKNWEKDNSGICSFQPEDIFLEDYSDKIKKKVENVSESKNHTTTQFVGSLLDGIDLRETLKNFNTGKLYVVDNPKHGGSVDAVVFIFTPEIEDHENKFDYKMTWWGEVEQESDMAFYSTSPGKEIIGKGISKCEYGGFLLFYPRYSLSDVWIDYDYDNLKNDEILVMSAIDYSITGIIALISAKPPNYKIKNWARRSGKKLIFIPIGSLSPSKIRRLRTFHILQGHGIRRFAGDYIDDPNKWDNPGL